jgi:vitamin B12/bleomycin/antimicrobial peptide transport system ATP-binding/permease protein
MEPILVPRDAQGVTSDRFDRLFWRRLWQLTLPYWRAERRRWALAMLIVIAVLNLGVVGMQAVFSYISRDVMNTLQAKDAARFYHLMMVFGV